MAGATVLVKRTSKSVLSGSDGQFSIDNVATNATLIILYVGYETKEVKYKEGSIANIILTDAAKSEDEVGVTGVFDKRTALNSSIAIFNYISKTGGDKFEGEVRTKFGLVRKMVFLNNHQQKNYFITKHDSI